jgi:hypothetical protein
MQTAEEGSPHRGFAILLGCCLSVVYFALVAVFAHKRLLWTDEIVTLVIASQSDLRGLFVALLDGPDTLPPLSHLLTRLSITALGASHVATRLPEAIGYWLAIVCTYQFIRRHYDSVIAYGAAIMLLAVDAFSYAFEARPYGLLAGFSALALLCWQRLSVSGSTVWAVALPVALFLAVSSHWYGVLAFLPIAAGEAVRWRLRSARRIRTFALLGLAAAASVVLAPFARNAVGFRGLIPPPSNLGQHLDSVYALAGGASLVLLLVALLVAGLVSRRSSGDDLDQADAAAALMAALLPVASFLLGQVTAGQLWPRYTIFAAVGVALVAGFSFGQLSSRMPWLKWAFASAACCAAAVNVSATKYGLAERSMVAEAKGAYALLAVDTTRLQPLPIVVSDMHTFLPLHYYAPSSLRDRLVYVRAEDLMASRMLDKLMPYAPYQVFDRRSYLERRSEFYYYEHGARSPAMAELLKSCEIRDAAANLRTDVYPRPGYLYRLKCVAPR